MGGGVRQRVGMIYGMAENNERLQQGLGIVCRVIRECNM